MKVLVPDFTLESDKLVSTRVIGSAFFIFITLIYYLSWSIQFFLLGYHASPPLIQLLQPLIVDLILVLGIFLYPAKWPNYLIAIFLVIANSLAFLTEGIPGMTQLISLPAIVYFLVDFKHARWLTVLALCSAVSVILFSLTSEEQLIAWRYLGLASSVFLVVDRFSGKNFSIEANDLADYARVGIVALCSVELSLQLLTYDYRVLSTGALAFVFSITLAVTYALLTSREKVNERAVYVLVVIFSIGYIGASEVPSIAWLAHSNALKILVMILLPIPSALLAVFSLFSIDYFTYFQIDTPWMESFVKRHLYGVMALVALIFSSRIYLERSHSLVRVSVAALLPNKEFRELFVKYFKRGLLVLGLFLILFFVFVMRAELLPTLHLILLTDPHAGAGIWLVTLLSLFVLMTFTSAFANARYEAMRARVSADEALKANEIKSRFLANMSHELRTPMNSVLGIAQLMAKPGRYSVDVEKNAARIVTAGHSLQKILNDILDFSKIENGSVRLIVEPTNLAELLDRVAIQMGSYHKREMIEIGIICDIPIQSTYQLDSLRLEQILVNLISNAIKFTSVGSVKLEVVAEEVDAKCARLNFTVTDTGIGIDEAAQHLIVEAFTQADDSITRRYGGTGLGLSITSKLLELMDSHLVITSEFGQGSSFSFSLETVKCISAKPLFNPFTDSDFALVVSPSSLYSQAAVTSLKGLSIDSKSVSSVADALEIIRDSQAHSDSVRLLIIDDQVSDAHLLKKLRGPGSELASNALFIRMRSDSEFERLSGLAVDAEVAHPITMLSLQAALESILQPVSRDLLIHDHLENRLLNGLKILVVDDSVFNRDVAKDIFESEGAAVTLAEDGQQAVEWLVANPSGADVIIMDVQMPVMDGLSATQMIRSIDGIQELPIIGMSGGGFDSDREQALAAGMNFYITKPIDVKESINTILKLTKHRLA